MVQSKGARTTIYVGNEKIQHVGNIVDDAGWLMICICLNRTSFLGFLIIKYGDVADEWTLVISFKGYTANLMGIGIIH